MGNSHDRLSRSRYGLMVVTTLTILIMMILSVYASIARQKTYPTTSALVEALRLNTPSLFPSGHAFRDTGYAHPAIDLRHSPFLPLDKVSN